MPLAVPVIIQGASRRHRDTALGIGLLTAAVITEVI